MNRMAALYTVVSRLSLDLDSSLMYLKGVGPARAAMLESKGLRTVEDLLHYPPFRYEDRSNVKTIAQLAPGEMATVIAEVRSAKLSGFRRKQPRAVRSRIHGCLARHLARQVVPWRAIWRIGWRPARKFAIFGRWSSIRIAASCR